MPWNFRGLPVRIVERDGELWFVAKDVAEVLGYADTSQAIRKHCKGGVETTLPSRGGPQRITIIPEADLYRLITRSRLPRAQEFERWVMEEVLPSIRKTGSYGHGGKAPPPAPVLDLNNPASLRAALLGYTEKVIALEAEVQEAAPKVKVYERIAAAEECRTVREAAKLLQVERGAGTMPPSSRNEYRCRTRIRALARQESQSRA